MIGAIVILSIVCVIELWVIIHLLLAESVSVSNQNEIHYLNETLKCKEGVVSQQNKEIESLKYCKNKFQKKFDGIIKIINEEN